MDIDQVICHKDKKWLKILTSLNNELEQEPDDYDLSYQSDEDLY